jgi:xanthine dehydrogenase YagR molybdenum-binding subunit
VADLAPAYPGNILDEDVQGVLGRPLPRIEGPLKVSGRATYTYEYAGAGKVAYGFIVGAGISNGRVVSIDTTEAKAVPGVLLIISGRAAAAFPMAWPAPSSSMIRCATTGSRLLWLWQRAWRMLVKPPPG